uniref:LIM zinc-binding domain-containing protein n=1 Tax=Glossina austeni TaxID=7395 RepID=A0A1A9VMV3_GLOAU
SLSTHWTTTIITYNYYNFFFFFFCVYLYVFVCEQSIQISLKLLTELRTCAACGEPISDRFYLEVGGCSWHINCLRCCMCMCPLDRQQSCFIRERKVYCKVDYSNTRFSLMSTYHHVMNF